LFATFSFNAYSLTVDDQQEDSRHRIGFYAGMGLSTITGLKDVDRFGLPNVDYSIDNFSSSPKIMWEIGFSYQYEKINKYFLQSNIIIFKSSGAKIKGVKNEDGNNIGAINTGGLLFNLFYGKKINIKNDYNIILGTGPAIYVNYYSGYGGSGDVVYYEKEYYDEYYDEYYYVKESSVVGGESPELNLFGLGVNTMIGVESKDWQLGLVSDYCLTKMFKDSDFNSHHKSIKLSFTYFFYQ